MKFLTIIAIVCIMLCPLVSGATEDIPTLESTYTVPGMDTDETRNRELIKDGVIPQETRDPRTEYWRIQTTIDPNGNIVQAPVPVTPPAPPAPAKVQKP